jgi:hypothetical protein
LEVLGFPILVKAKRIFENQFCEAIVPYAAGTLGLPNTSLLHGAADGPGGGGIELAWRVRPQPLCFASAQGCQDTGASGMTGFRGSVPQADPQASTTLKTEIQRHA